MFGISIPRKYYYGEGTDHIVKLTKAEADAVNKIRLHHVRGRIYEVNLNREELKHYESAATKLNRYLETATSPVMVSDEFLATNNILRPEMKEESDD